MAAGQDRKFSVLLEDMRWEVKEEKEEKEEGCTESEYAESEQ